MINDQKPARPLSSAPPQAGGPSNQPALTGEAPPPAYTASPLLQGLPTFSSPHPPPGTSIDGVFHPPPANVAASRARVRFFKALVVAFLIWVFVGAIFGGGIEDMEEDKHRRERHGRYPPPPRVTYYQEGMVPEPVLVQEVVN